MRKFTDKEFVIHKVKEYFNVHSTIPTLRQLEKIKDMPCHTTIIKLFNSYENLLLESGFTNHNRSSYFNKKIVSNDTALELLKYYTQEKHNSGNLSLLTAAEINKNNNMPCMSVYSTRLGGLKNAYKLIGIDYNDYIFKLKQSIIKDEYKKLAKKLNRTPRVEDINMYLNKGSILSYKNIQYYFGSLKILQELCDLEFNKHSTPTKTKEQMQDDLKRLSSILGRIPQQNDLNNYDFILSSHSYNTHFGSFTNALKEIGFTDKEIKNKIHMTPNGTKCYSRLEYLFARVLENFNIDFNKEVKYKEIIPNLKKRYKFDFVLNIDNQKIYVEIFGITGDEKYNKRVQEKIQICKNNNLTLLEIYPDLLWSSKQKDVYEYILQKAS